MKVMMVQLPHFHDGVRRSPAVYPLGIGYLVSVLKGRHDLVPLDLWLEDVPMNRVFKLIDKTRPDVFCVSVYAAQYSYFKPFVAELKKRYGLDADIISDTFDFASGNYMKDSYSNHFRGDFKISEDEIVFLQPTRIVRRKRIELSIEFIAQGLKDAVSHLDNILGKNLSQDLLSRIFSKFCIGR